MDKEKCLRDKEDKKRFPVRKEPENSGEINGKIEVKDTRERRDGPGGN